jgi:hypothetical protein
MSSIQSTAAEVKAEFEQTKREGRLTPAITEQYRIALTILHLHEELSIAHETQDAMNLLLLDIVRTHPELRDSIVGSMKQILIKASARASASLEITRL